MHSFLKIIIGTAVFGASLSAALGDSFPSDLEAKRFSGPDVAPCPACLCASAQGDVFVGVDLNGSLGKGPGKGRIVKLVDRDRDGVADSHTVFAEVNNPRGLISVGTRLFVLHTAYDGSRKSTGMDLVVFDDANGDGVADGPPGMLVRGICSAASINARGTDHSTNGIRMGIDGWIYIAVGDFGFHDATGTDGTKLTLLGGGIVRVRPDGTEMELYTTGTRNIYDVAIDPFMNCYTRGNTNDGGGWNIRFLHHIQSGEYGYPRLFQNFVSEIIPALEDLGGGSGVGSLYLSEPTWPEKYNNQPLMADWGRKAVYIHRLTPDGPSFTEKVEEMMEVSQVTDLDVDPAGQLFVSAWDGAGFSGDPNKGYVVRVTPKGWKNRVFPAFSSYKSEQLLQLLTTASASTRFYAQQEILARPAELAALKPVLVATIRNGSLTLAVRVAALFTLAQIEPDPKNLLVFASDEALCEFALRAATDRLPRLKAAKVPLGPFLAKLKSGTPRQRAVSAIALGRIGDLQAAPALLDVAFTKPDPARVAAGKSTDKPAQSEAHATPNPGIIVPHLAAHALVRLDAVEACLGAVGTPSEDLALWALSGLHEPSVADGLLAKLKAATSPAQRVKLVTTLGRLYQQEASYDGSWWWTTRPDSHGPYYKPVIWSASPRIAAALEAETVGATPAQLEFLARLNDSHRLGLAKLGSLESGQVLEKRPTVDLAKIASQKGAVASTPVEDVILAVESLKPNHSRGKVLFTQQGCVACHALEQGGPSLGPYMGQIGSIMNAEQIATAILRPSDSISQGFQTVNLAMKDGSFRTGFVSETTADHIVLRDVTGAVTTVGLADVKEQTHVANSMMPENLASALSLEDFTALVRFLASKK